MLREQCSLLSHKGWAPWWDLHVEPTPHVRGGSITPRAPKYFPVKYGLLNRTCGPSGTPLDTKGREGAIVAIAVGSFLTNQIK